MFCPLVQSRKRAYHSLLQGSFYDVPPFPSSDCRCSRYTCSRRYINNVPVSCCLSSLTLSFSLHGRWPNVSVSTESKPQSLCDFQDVLRWTRIHLHLPHYNHEGLRRRGYRLLHDPKCWIGFPLPGGSCRTHQPAQDRTCCPNYRICFPDGCLLRFYPLYNTLPSQEHSTQRRSFGSPSTIVLGTLPHSKSHHYSFHLPNYR